MIKKISFGPLFVLLFAISFLFFSCGSAKFVDPLPKGRNAISAELGGPVIKLPGVATLPIPFTSITYGRGVTKDLTLFGSWYSTASVFGVAQIDAGASYRLWESKNAKNGISGMLGFNTAFDFLEYNYKLWPQLDVHYYWRYNDRQIVQDDLLTGGKPRSNLFYAGIGTWYELAQIKAHGEKQTTFVVPMLNIGHDLNIKRWTFNAELKLIAPVSSNQNIVVDYFSLTGKTGATGIYLGITYRF